MATISASCARSPLRLALIGYRCVGKSTLAQTLATALTLPYHSSDTLIAETAKLPLNELIAQSGWDVFRRLEYRIIQTVLKNPNALILDCGGGVVENQTLMSLIQRETCIIYLSASFSTILKRLQTSTRPRLTQAATLESETRSKLAERIPHYLHYAQLTQVSQPHPETTLQQLLQTLYSKGIIDKLPNGRR